MSESRPVPRVEAGHSPSSPWSSAPRGRSRDGSLALLVVDDNPGDAFLVEALLDEADAGFEVSSVASLREAVECLGHSQTDLCVLDLGLGDSQGLDTFRQLHELRPDVPVVVLTGLNSTEVGDKAVELGAQDYLLKGSLDGRSLAERLRYAHERHRLLQQIRKLADDAVLRDVQRRALVDNLSDGVCVVGSDGCIRFLNPAARSMLGVADADLIGSPFPVQFGLEQKLEVRIDGDDGQVRHVLVRSSPLDWDGSPAAVVTLHDISERRRNEELREQLIHADRLVAIGQLAASVAHEITNPASFVFANHSFLLELLDGLKGLLEDLDTASTRDAAIQPSELEAMLGRRRGWESIAEMKTILDENREGMRRIQSIASDLRTFARIEREAPEPVDLNEVVEAAARMASNEIRHRARLIKTLGDLPIIEAERGKLIQVVTNLLVNAAQAIEGGQAEHNEIRVATGMVEDQVVVRVSDTGPGVPAAIAKRIFDPFFTTKGREEGTGLGLSLCLEVARKHGGSIELVDTQSPGACFELSLPARVVAPRRAVSEAPQPVAMTRARVLVVDDEPNLLRSYRRMLMRYHEVSTARGGAEGLAVLTRNADFDAVVCDLMMPDVDGPTFYRAVQQRWPDLAERVVFSSGGAFTEHCREFVGELPEERVLHKPVDVATLLSAIALVVTARTD